MKEFYMQQLRDQGIDIHDPDYKKSEEYIKIKDDLLFSSDGSMTMEEYIERYLLESNEVLDTYESIYEMGNSYELDVEDCQYTALAEEIITIMDLPDAVAVDFAFRFERPNGYIDQLKKHLNFDLESFDQNNLRHQREKFKILYLVYILKHKYFPGVNVLELLTKPSMENIDNSFLDWKTKNGSIIKTIKNALEKELSINAKNNIRGAVFHVVSAWDEFLIDVSNKTDLCASIGYEIDFERIIGSLKSVPIYADQNNTNNRFTPPSPIEMLYLKILQHEQIGQIQDILDINKILTGVDYSVQNDFIEQMKEKHHKKIAPDDIIDYINNNISDIAKYVYLKHDTSYEERKRVLYHKEKLPTILQFCIRAKPLIHVEDVVTELWIISCLQAILRDEKNETFDYIFYGYENHSKRKPQVQGALKGDKEPYDALKIYWVRKVMEHWYANIGRYNLKCKLRELENICDITLISILECDTIDKMMEMHQRYYSSLSCESV